MSKFIILFGLGCSLLSGGVGLVLGMSHAVAAEPGLLQVLK